jgi:hypothetical protein
MRIGRERDRLDVSETSQEAETREVAHRLMISSLECVPIRLWEPTEQN